MLIVQRARLRNPRRWAKWCGSACGSPRKELSDQPCQDLTPPPMTTPRRLPARATAQTRAVTTTQARIMERKCRILGLLLRVTRDKL